MNELLSGNFFLSFSFVAAAVVVVFIIDIPIVKWTLYLEKG